MTNAEMITALRYCVVHPFRPCNGCVLFETDGCINVLHGAAADALEAAEKRIAELEARLPKEGAWIDGDARKVTARCSVCGHLRLGNGAKWANMYVPFCEICGAKMDGKEKTDADS